MKNLPVPFRSCSARVSYIGSGFCAFSGAVTISRGSAMRSNDMEGMKSGPSRSVERRLHWGAPLRRPGKASTLRARMKLIPDIHEACRADGRPAISFEFFPPRTEDGDRNLLERTIPALLELKPDYCSV